MTRKRRTAFKAPPKTIFEESGIPKPPVILERRILCSRCGLGGGTLVKVDEGEYAHQDEEKCKILRQRRH